jgi:hypothetical protein
MKHIGWTVLFLIGLGAMWGIGSSCGKAAGPPKTLKETKKSTVETQKGPVDANNTPVVESINYKDPASVARAALLAIKKNDIDRLVATVPEHWMAQARDSFVREGENHRFFRKTGWQHLSIQAWDGKIIETRIRQRAALVKYGEQTGNGETLHLVARLLNFNGSWFFKDLDNRSQRDFDRYLSGKAGEAARSVTQ